MVTQCEKIMIFIPKKRDLSHKLSCYNIHWTLCISLLLHKHGWKRSFLCLKRYLLWLIPSKSKKKTAIVLNQGGNMPQCIKKEMHRIWLLKNSLRVNVEIVHFANYLGFLPVLIRFQRPNRTQAVCAQYEKE